MSAITSYSNDEAKAMDCTADAAEAEKSPSPFIDIPVLEAVIKALKQKVTDLTKHYKDLLLTQKDCRQRVAGLQKKAQYRFEESFGETCLKLKPEEIKILENDAFGCMRLSLTAESMLNLRREIEDHKNQIYRAAKKLQDTNAQLYSLGSPKSRHDRLASTNLLPSPLMAMIAEYDISSAYSTPYLETPFPFSGNGK